MGQTCRSCGSGKLIRAHIIPASFGRLAVGEGKHLKQISRQSKKPLNSGIWDPHILCHSCDQVLNRYDKYGIEFCRSFGVQHIDTGNDMFVVKGVETERLVKFIMSILWRASITNRPEFSAVCLGPYEQKFKQALFRGDDCAICFSADVILLRYLSSKIAVDQFYTMPMYATIEGVNWYVFALGGFRILAKVDKRKTPPLFQDFVINGKDFVSGFWVPLENTQEFNVMSKIVKTLHNRRVTSRSSATRAWAK